MPVPELEIVLEALFRQISEIYGPPDRTSRFGRVGTVLVFAVHGKFTDVLERLFEVSAVKVQFSHPGRIDDHSALRQ